MKSIKFLEDNGVNIKRSLELFGDSVTCNETIGEFLVGIHDKINKLIKFMQNRDMANYAIMAHSMKSDANNFGGILDTKTKADVTEHYLSIPVMFNAGLTITDGIVGRIYAGPTLAYGIASNLKYTASASIPVLGTVSKGDKVNNYDDSDYGRFDVMLGGGVAVDFFDMVRFNVGYDYGLVNRYTGDGDMTRHRSQFNIGVAYLF